MELIDKQSMEGQRVLPVPGVEIRDNRTCAWCLPLSVSFTDMLLANVGGSAFSNLHFVKGTPVSMSGNVTGQFLAPRWDYHLTTIVVNIGGNAFSNIYYLNGLKSILSSLSRASWCSS
jgi:hypothetical protein